MTSFDELVAGAVHRHDEPRLLGIRFQFVSQMNDVRVDRAGVRVILIAPHRIQQAVAAERFRGMGDEVGEQGELLRRELDGAAGAPYLVAANVDLDVAEPIDVRGAGLRRTPAAARP